MSGPTTPVVTDAVIAAVTPAEVETVLRMPAVTQAVLDSATQAQITAAITSIPWWKSRVMVSAYIGIGIAAIDAVVQMAEKGPISWRTAVIAVGSAVAAWGRRNATETISGYFGAAK